VRVDETTIEIAGAPVYFRSASVSAAGDSETATPLYLHGVPSSSDDWTSLLERTGGLAPDLRGFGRTAKGGHLDYSIEGYADFVEQFLDDRGVDRIKLVAHAWGAVPGLVYAQRHPDRVERVVLIDPVPLFGGGREPRLVRTLRIPVLGELAMGATNRAILARALWRGTTQPELTWPKSRVDAVWAFFDQGTQRAILRVLRCADEERLAAGASLRAVAAQTLVIHGDEDPWLPQDLVDEWTQRLPNATAETVPQAGHWPWLDRPELVERIAQFIK
jgi:pimeloyl-ACP methyl ester carboxylesterase